MPLEPRNTFLLRSWETAIDRTILNNPLVMVLCAVLLRICVGLHSHSGENDPPLFGDFEAQRHWLEICVTLDLREWYVEGKDNDLQYWGLDYPPLTAYVSYLFGLLAQTLYPSTVALHESRGNESMEIKTLMRFSVLLCDLVVYFSGVLCFCNEFYTSNIKVNNNQPGFAIYSRDYVPTMKRKGRLRKIRSELGMRHHSTTQRSTAFEDNDTQGGDDTKLRRRSLRGSGGAGGFVNDESRQKKLVLAKSSSDNNLLRKAKEENRIPRGTLAVALVSEVLLLILLQPSLVLIDHGHFQYNSFSLGLVVWMAYFLIRDERIKASVAFCLSLNFKQTSLYYAPVVFCFLLSLSIRSKPYITTQPNIEQPVTSPAVTDEPRDNSNIPKTKTKSNTIQYDKIQFSLQSVCNVLYLGVTVICVFGLLWLPFCYSEVKHHQNTTSIAWSESAALCGHQVTSILSRIFPFHRGVFEDKVSNVWCSVDSIGVIKFKKIFTQQQMALICLLATLVSIIPCCVNLLLSRPSVRKLLWALYNCALSFFLFSFQVHEKSILWPLLPIAMLVGEAPGPSLWFSLTSAFSMTPLLLRDGLAVPYVVLVCMYWLNNILAFGEELRVLPIPYKTEDGVFYKMLDVSIVLFGMMFIGMLLQGLLFFVQPPDRYPDLWVVLISVYSCAIFCALWMYGNWCQWMMPNIEMTTSGEQTTKEHED